MPKLKIYVKWMKSLERGFKHYTSIKTFIQVTYFK